MKHNEIILRNQAHPRLTAAATTHAGNGTSMLYIDTGPGYIELGPANSSHCHIQTDRTNFYFNKELVVNTGVIGSYDEDLYLRRASNSSHQIQIGPNYIATSIPLELSHEGGSSATNGGRFLHAKYSGDNRIGVFSSQYGSGNLLIGNGMAYDSGANQIVSTFANFSGSRTGLNVQRGNITLIGTTGAIQTTVDSAITTQETFLHQTTDGYTRIGTPTGTQNSRLAIYKADNNVADHIIFYNGGTRVGEIGVFDNSWLRLNQTTANNIYTPRLFRADGGLYTTVGSATNPTFAIQDDNNTGMYSPGSDQLAFTTGGTRRVNISTSAINFYLDADAPYFNGTSGFKVNGTEVFDGNRVLKNVTRAEFSNFTVTGTSTTSPSYLRYSNIAANVEGSHMSHPYFFNDLANFTERGGTVTIGGLNFTPAMTKSFKANPDFASWAASNYSGSTMTVTLTNLPKPLSYGGYIGIAFGNTGWAPASCKIEISTDGGSTWTTRLNDSSKKEIYFTTTGTGGTALNAIRFTLGQPTSSLRLTNIWAYNYNSNGMEDYFLSKGGGTVYGDVTTSGSFITATASSAQGIYAGSMQVLEGSTRNLKNISTISSGEITTTAAQFKYVSNTDANVGLLIRDETYVSNEADITATRLNSGANLTLGLAGQAGINAYVNGSNVFSLNSSGNATFAGTLSSGAISSSSYGLFGITTIDPDSYLGKAGGFGNIADGGGWGARGLFIHGGGTGDAAAIAHNGSSLYFGIQNGSSANSMTTWMVVSPARAVDLTNSTSIALPNTTAGTITSGAITVNGGATQSVIKSSSDAPLIVESTDAFSGINFKDTGGNSSMYYRGSDDHLYLHSAKFSVAGSTIVSGYQFQVNGSANLTGSLAIGGTTVIDSSRNLTNIGTISSANIDVTGASGGNGQITVSRTSGSTVTTQAQSARGIIGTGSNHPFRLMSNGTQRIELDTSGNFNLLSGALEINGTTVIDSNRTHFSGVKGFNTTATGNTSTTASTGIKQTYSEGWTAVFADYEPYHEWGLYHDNPNNDFYVTSGTSTNNIGSFTVVNHSGNNRTAYKKIRFDQDEGSIRAGGGYYVGNTTVIDSSRNLTNIGTISSGAISATGNSEITGSGSTGRALDVHRGSDSASALYVLNTGEVLIPSNYLYVNASQGAYFTGAIRARGGISNDGGNNLSITSGGTDITFNSKNFTSVGTISSGAITSTGTITSDVLIVKGGDSPLETAWGTAPTAIIGGFSSGNHDGSDQLTNFRMAVISKDTNGGNTPTMQRNQAWVTGGISGEAYNSAARWDLGRWQNNGTDSRSRLDLYLADDSQTWDHVMTWRADGSNATRVGINTTTPTATLDVNGQISSGDITSTGTISSSTIHNTGVIYLGSTATANDQFATNNGTDIFLGTSAKGLRTYKDLHTNSGNNKYWHAGNDGTGSGLDADTVDSLQASQFLRSDTDDTATGAINFTSSGLKLSSHFYTNRYDANGNVYFHVGTADSVANRLNLRVYDANNGYKLFHLRGDNGYISWNNNEIWHAGNDGTGSGLDADTVDSLQASQFLRSDAADTASGKITFTAAESIELTGIRGAAVGSQTGDFIHLYERVNIGYPNGWGGQGAPSYGLSTHGGAQFNVGNVSNAPFTFNNHTVWHAGNDGSGSGLDADTVDSLQASQFLRSDADDTFTGTYLTMSGDFKYASSGLHFYFTNNTAKRVSFDSDGGIYATGNITAYSDIRVKENIELIPNALEKVQQIRGVTFTRNDNVGDSKDKRYAGVIAQEIEQILPEVVETNEDGIKSVAYGNMVGLLIEAVKELKQEVDDLKAQLKEK